MIPDPSVTIDELVSAISYVLDIDSKKNTFHSWRVAILASLFAKDSVNYQAQKDILYASLLMDIGSVGLPRHITYYLTKNDSISHNILLSHPIISCELIASQPHMAAISDLIQDHHEWYNGDGYPRGKKGKEITWAAQILRLADACDIILQIQPRCTVKKMAETLQARINKEFSKKLVEHAMSVLSRNKAIPELTSGVSVKAELKRIKKDIGLLNIPARSDSIGTILDVMSQVIDMKHPFTSGHSLRVSRYALSCALAMKLDHDIITQVKWAGLIHDIGKISVPRDILDKPSSLTPDEFEQIKKHAEYTAKTMTMVGSLKEVGPIAWCHHEYFDGSGYPQGLRGTHIPLGARILTVCDAFDAMTSSRPYRPPMSAANACREIQRLSGKQFDPAIVEIAVPLLKNFLP